MFNFYIKNHESIGSVTKNCLYLDKNKSIMSTFSVFVVYRSAVSTIQTRNYVRYFNLRHANVCICKYVSRYFNKI